MRQVRPCQLGAAVPPPIISGGSQPTVSAMLPLLIAAAASLAALDHPCGGESVCDCACVVGAHGVPEFSRRFVKANPTCGHHATQAIHPSVVSECGGDASVAEAILRCTGNRAFNPQCYEHGSMAVELVAVGTAASIALWLPTIRAAAGSS